MVSATALATAERIGARAGQSFLDTGIWPRTPFRDETGRVVAEVARAWRDGLFAVIRPVLGAQQRGKWSGTWPDAYTVAFGNRPGPQDQEPRPPRTALANM